MQIHISTNTIRILGSRQKFLPPIKYYNDNNILHILYSSTTKRIPTIVFIIATAHRSNRSNYIKYHIIKQYPLRLQIFDSTKMKYRT